MGIKEKLDEILADFTLIKADLEASKKELEQQSELLNISENKTEEQQGE